MIPKFRAWDKKRGMMKVFGLLQNCSIAQLYNDDYSSYMAFVDEIKLMQSTGLKDKNGIEIFEGDILKIVEVSEQGIEEYLTDVKWEDCSFVVKSSKFRDYYDTFLAAWSGDHNMTYPLFEIEVIGNIYENPDLLEES